MHIQQVILDGFKSYADRTDIGTFDPHFNAITGLNGSGKSNILDGIIFVLGLSSLHTVRAQSLADLIHKGSTQVKKAQVSIVFNNKDKRPGKCPPGYEKFNEILVSRTIEPGLICKYYLNGHVSTKKAIQDMFESVHLNINNPNFMIMQGKITKVVNMKPKELLHMIEETVGALSYQNKRDKSCKEIDDRERQLTTSNRIMDEVIQPAVERQLRAARLIDEYKFCRIRLDKASGTYALASYAQYSKELCTYNSKLHKLENVDKNAEERVTELQGLIKSKKKEHEAITKESNERLKEKLATLEKTKGNERKKLAGIEAKFESATANVEDAKTKVKSTEKAYNDEVKQMEDYKKKSAHLIEEFTATKEDIQTAEDSLKAAKDQEAELNAGKILGDDGRAVNLRERLIVVDDEIGKIRPSHDHEAKLVSNEMRALKEKEVELSNTPSDTQIEMEFKRQEAVVVKLKKTLAQKQLVPEEFPMIEKRFAELKVNQNRLEQQIRAASRDHPFLLFTYRDPSPNFNRDSVHGCLYELFEVKDMQTYGKALEVAIGGGVSTVIVDTPQISKDLINRGDLQRRTTFMPISAIRDRQSITQNELDKKLGRNKAFPAVDLLSCEPKYAKVIQNYFGSTVICVDQPTAKVVAYQLQYKAITLDGDVISSDGIMQGGHRPNLGELLAACDRLRRFVLEERVVRSELNQLQAKLDLYNKEATLISEYQKAERMLTNASETRQCTAYATLVKEIAQLKEIIETRSSKIKAWADEMNVWKKEQKSLTEKLDHFEENKAKSMKSTQTLITKWTKALETAKKKYDAKQATFNEIALELASKETLIKTCTQEIEQAKKELEERVDELKKHQDLLTEAKTVFEAKDADYEDAVKEAQLLEEQVSHLLAEVDTLQQRIQEVELEKLNRDNNKKEVKDRIKGLKGTMDGLKKKYTDIDFEHPENNPVDEDSRQKSSIAQMKAEIDQQEKELEERRLRLDYASAGKADESQGRLTTALERIAQVTKNRHHIKDAIEVLDVQKMQLVNSAFDSINKEFGSMMSTLLPESSAKLVPVKPGELEAGVNIHVCLGGLWKESLSELSGGQRSLVALSLVLSLCLFCPAPFYVLDEIDAALDLSHTQNIGVIIQQRFKDTQFVCVSLKDGMYSNCNVLFQTSFTNGKSAVTRSYSTKK